ncbi:MAG: glycoside hydrolase family 32 protein [Lentisphaeria bacterium]
MSDDALRQAQASVRAGEARAMACEARPRWHFTAPAYWMNDPNGVMYHGGYYHLFYQHNPFADSWGHMHWGHARSRDLLRWEHLPIAFGPSAELGEEHCFSGCAAFPATGRPMLFYTMVPPKGSPSGHEQWAVLAEDDELRRWRKDPANPILCRGRDGTPQFEAAWRDPFVFSAAGRQFMVLGAAMPGEKGRRGVALWESDDPQLKRWHYRGWLFAPEDTDIRFFECPNFFPVGDQWLLLSSPYGPVHYWLGDFSPERGCFTPHSSGLLDGSADYYATNVIMNDPKGRLPLLAWGRGFPAGMGWNGCLAMPREVTLSAAGRLRVRPLSEMIKLRGAEWTPADSQAADSTARVVELPSGECEIDLRGTLPNSGLTLALSSVAQPQKSVSLHIADGRWSCLDKNAALPDSAGADFALRLFLDRSFLECCWGDGDAWLTKAISYLPAPIKLSISAGNSSGDAGPTPSEQGALAAMRLRAWPLG